jgi:hypothetical protein
VLKVKAVFSALKCTPQRINHKYNKSLCKREVKMDIVIDYWITAIRTHGYHKGFILETSLKAIVVY